MQIFVGAASCHRLFGALGAIITLLCVLPVPVIKHGLFFPRDFNFETLGHFDILLNVDQYLSLDHITRRVERLVYLDVNKADAGNRWCLLFFSDDALHTFLQVVENGTNETADHNFIYL